VNGMVAAASEFPVHRQKIALKPTGTRRTRTGIYLKDEQTSRRGNHAATKKGPPDRVRISLRRIILGSSGKAASTKPARGCCF